LAATARIPGRSTVGPQPEIRIVIADGESSLEPDSVQLAFGEVMADGSVSLDSVTANVSRDGDVTTITYTPSEPLNPLTVYEVDLSFQDNADPANNLGTRYRFAVGDFENNDFFPGIPGTGGHTTQFATEIIAYLELEAGFHRFGGKFGSNAAMWLVVLMMMDSPCLSEPTQKIFWMHRRSIPMSDPQTHPRLLPLRMIISSVLWRLRMVFIRSGSFTIRKQEAPVLSGTPL